MLFRGWICVSLFSQKLHFLIYIISQLTSNYFLQLPHKMNSIGKDWKLVWRYVPNFIIFSIFSHKLWIFPDIFSKFFKLSLSIFFLVLWHHLQHLRRFTANLHENVKFRIFFSKFHVFSIFSKRSWARVLNFFFSTKPTFRWYMPIFSLFRKTSHLKQICSGLFLCKNTRNW